MIDNENIQKTPQEQFEALFEDIQKTANELDQISKNIHSLDVYHITTSVSTQLELYQAINTLAPGESLVINSLDKLTYVFGNEEQPLGRGDIITRLIDGNLIYIQSLSSGIYFPSKIVKEPQPNTYTITYSYSTQEPEKDSSGTITDQTLTIPYEELKYSIETGAPSTIYYHFDELQSIIYDFDVVKLEEEDIDPVIRFYIKQDTYYEEIALTYTLIKNVDEWHITLTEGYPTNTYILIK